MRIELTVNGAPRSDEVEPRLLLVHYLRQRCGLRAANVGCDTTSCGACTVLVNGRSVKSCTMLAVQAAGQEITYDENGNNLAGSFMDYLLPTAMETPSWETDKTITPSPHHPLGAKGVGESATVGAPPAIVNAVVDALAHLGVRHIDIPMTPERVWNILREKGVAE